MKMRCQTDTGGNDQQVLDDILSSSVGTINLCHVSEGSKTNGPNVAIIWNEQKRNDDAAQLL